MLEDLYQELILDHHKNPRCRGKIEDADARSVLFNQLCGDEVELEIKVEGDLVSDIRFVGNGCAISQASASMLGEICKGKKIEDVRGQLANFIEMMKGKKKNSEDGELGDAQALEGVRRFPTRIRCAMLAWEALDKCLAKLESDVE